MKNALYAQQLVDDLKLTYQLQSNMLPLKTKSISMTRFVKELIIDILNSPEYAGREIAFVPDDADKLFTFDPQLMRRAIINVIVNALKHNSPQTSITVSVVANERLTVSVSDNGAGMTAQELEGLFSRYYRGTDTEVSSEGSGLGMAIAKEIVEAHGGQISAESKPDCGTTVTMTF